MLNRRPAQKKPNLSAQTPMMERIRRGLDISNLRLSEVLGITPSETRELCASGAQRELGEDDVMYERLLNYVNERAGAALAIRQELYVKLQADRTARLARRERIRGQ